jgi:hypothetical protein
MKSSYGRDSEKPKVIWTAVPTCSLSRDERSRAKFACSASTAATVARACARPLPARAATVSFAHDRFCACGAPSGL